MCTLFLTTAAPFSQCARKMPASCPFFSRLSHLEANLQTNTGLCSTLVAVTETMDELHCVLALRKQGSSSWKIPPPPNAAWLLRRLLTRLAWKLQSQHGSSSHSCLKCFYLFLIHFSHANVDTDGYSQRLIGLGRSLAVASS